MKDQEFEALRARAVELHSLQKPKERRKVSLDAIFMCLAARSLPARPKGRHDTKSEPIPEWFTETLEAVKDSGEELTVSRFLMLAGRFPSQRVEELAVGRWLRRLGYKPTKRGGQLLFKL